MYDKDQIEDSLEFCRQIKDFYGNEDSSPKAEKVAEQNTDELFANLASNADRPWEKVLEKTVTSGAFSDAKKEVPSPPIQMPGSSAPGQPHNLDAKLREAGQEKEQKEKAQEQARATALAKAEALRRAAEEEKRKQAEEAEKLAAIQKAQQQAEKRRKEEEAARVRAKAEEEERRRQAEILEQKRREAEQAKRQREQAEEQMRRRQAMAEEQKRLQAQLAAEQTRQAEEAEKLRQQKLAEQREAEERRKAEEAERIRQQKLAEQRKEEEKRQAEEAEKQRQQQVEEAERLRRQASVEQTQTVQQPQASVDAETLRLQKRAEELKRQAEIAALEARMHQLEVETEEARQRYQEIEGTAAPTSVSHKAVTPPAQETAQPEQRTVQPEQKLSKEQIDAIFAEELQKSQQENEAQRKEKLRKHTERVKALQRQQQKEEGRSSSFQPLLEKIVDIKDAAVETVQNAVGLLRERNLDSETRNANAKIKKIASNVLVVLICVLVAYLLALAVTTFVAKPTKVEGESMETTLTNGDTVIIQKLSYYFHDPERYDVVVFPVPFYNSNTKYIKRVIGLPGETVQIVDGKVYINGEELKDDRYGKEEYIKDPGDAAEPLTLADDEYFVLGDNRNMSTDSRVGDVGLIRRKNIMGEAWERVWPFSRFGSIE